MIYNAGQLIGFFIKKIDMPVIKFLQFCFVVYMMSLSRIVITNEYSATRS